MSVRTLNEPGLSDSDRNVIENVARYGTHVVKVGSSRPTPTPEWAYTIGLYQTFGHPEVILFGLPTRLSHELLNDVRDLIANGHRFLDGCVSDEVLNGHPAAFRNVCEEWVPAYAGVMQWFYNRTPVPVVQMFWPDRANRFPWEAGFDIALSGKQPLLYHPVPAAAQNADYLAELESSGHWPPSSLS